MSHNYYYYYNSGNMFIWYNEHNVYVQLIYNVNTSDFVGKISIIFIIFFFKDREEDTI